MTDTFHAVVTGVYAEDLGDQLTAAASIGDAVLHVQDVADFDEDGGSILLNDVVLGYDTVDDDTSTITLSAALTTAAAVDDRVDVWDEPNASKATVYKAVVDQIDGFDGVANAVVQQSVAHVLSQTMRDGTGESVTLTRDDDNELQLVAVHGRGFSLAALQYLQGGMTTRSAEDQPGIDILGNDTGTPGLHAYDSLGNPTVLIDALTGDASFVGELGTAPPGELGIFLFSQTFSRFGALVTSAVMQLNTGASRDQPSIQGDSASTGAGIYVNSGAGTSGRESRVVAEQAQILLQIERTADSSPDYGTQLQLNDDAGLLAVVRNGTGGANGALWILANDQIVYQTDYTFGSANKAAVLIGNITSYQAGFRDNSDGSMEGLWLTRGGDVVLSTVGAVDVQNPGNTAFKPINASAFNVSSDAASKTDFADAPDAVKIIRSAPAKRWRYKTDPKSTRRIGPVADDLPRWLVGRRAKDHKVAPGEQYVDIARLNGVLWRAVEQQQEQIDALAARLADLEARQEKP